ncbi:hypothetical protein [Gimesia chilikensis]|uniref:Uncharacterized protein n=1 Tax=Gimesia chilikensis TaxID=2605989 RepID=A0A517PYK3_9PLAN|nr:hypothetical protein [Gimesia chilikensis]QDT24460.1 hypothetical protein HG66A1_62920 [Gimesia chilikensis]
MYRKVFPRCEVEGSLEPVAFSHFGSTDHIPRKCTECENMFEGECVRAMDQVEDYLSLDYGPCRKSGLCNPVLFEDQYIKSKVYVPEKCRDCFNLKYHAVFGFRCHEDDQIWGRYGKTLDWGHWSPDLPNIGLESRKEVSMELLQAVKDEQEVAAIRIYQELHPGTTIREARDAYEELKEKLQRYGDDETEA